MTNQSQAPESDRIQAALAEIIAIGEEKPVMAPFDDEWNATVKFYCRQIGRMSGKAEVLARQLRGEW